MKTFLENLCIVIMLIIIVISITTIVFLEEILSRHQEWYWVGFILALVVLYAYVKYLWKRTEDRDSDFSYFDESEIYTDTSKQDDYEREPD